MRTMPADYFTTLDDDVVLPVYFVELQFDSGTLFYHTDIGSITTTGTSPNKTWTGVGPLGKVSGISEELGINPNGARLNLSGIDADLLDEALNEDFFEREIFIYFGLRNAATGDMIDEPFEIFSGFMDQMNVAVGPGEFSITLTAESEFIEFQKSRLEYYTNAQQQRDYTGDLFFEYLPQVINQSLKWGDLTVDPPGARDASDAIGGRGTRGSTRDVLNAVRGR